MATEPPSNPLPIFYGGLEPLSSSVHAGFRSKSADRAPFLVKQHAVPITVDEFVAVQRFYPIVFSSGENPVPLALMGLNEGVNVFVDGVRINSAPATGPVNEVLGLVGGNGARPYANACLEEADLVVFVGTRTDSTTTSHWTLPPIENPPRIIQIDAAPFEVGNNYPVVVGLVGDARLTLVDGETIHSA